MRGVYHSKTAPPRIHGVVPRVRLFNLLDSLASYPVSWISSPAGSGKTTLVASYLATRRIPALWYLVDEADSDVARQAKVLETFSSSLLMLTTLGRKSRLTPRLLTDPMSIPANLIVRPLGR